VRTHDDLFHADLADFILETRISGCKDLEDFNRSGMNRIIGILGIYKLECASINDMNIKVILSPFTFHRLLFTVHFQFSILNFQFNLFFSVGEKIFFGGLWKNINK